MLELAARLRGLSREALAAALHSREFDPSGVRDLFDLAEAVLTPDSIDQAVGRLDRRHLAVLAAAVELVADGDTTVEGVQDALVRYAASAELTDAASALLDELGALMLLVRIGDRVHGRDRGAAHLVARVDDGGEHCEAATVEAADGMVDRIGGEERLGEVEEVSCGGRVEVARRERCGEFLSRQPAESCGELEHRLRVSSIRPARRGHGGRR